MTGSDLAVVALGGNVILKAEEEATANVQLANIEAALGHLLPLLSSYPRLVLTHGNGPQVGNILLRNQICHGNVPSMPLDVCVAESQGQMAYLIQQAWDRVCRRSGVRIPMLSIITRTEVSRDDASFLEPTKPIGPFYSEKDAKVLEHTMGWRFVPDPKRRGFRRAVPSPDAVRIVEGDQLRALCDSMVPPFILLCNGGGGVPVISTEKGYEGVEVVVDKDLASSRLALGLQADILIMVTDVEAVYLDFNSENPRPLRKVTAHEMRRYAADGHFPPGSMGPKVEAAARYAESSGRRAVITTAEKVMDALRGNAGTTVE